MVQFKYGDDGLDPASIEGAEKPVAFERNLSHAIQTNFYEENKEYLLPWEIQKIMEDELETPKFKKTCSNEFLQALRSFISDRIIRPLVEKRKRDGLIPALEKSELGKIDTPSKGNITRSQLRTFLDICSTKYARSMIEPGMNFL
jgi:DNA-directed RNA polymerase III subunit RPC1